MASGLWWSSINFKPFRYHSPEVYILKKISLWYFVTTVSFPDHFLQCVRLDQLQNYQHLLQQFTTANVSSFAMNSTLQVKDSTQETMTRNTAKR